MAWYSSLLPFWIQNASPSLEGSIGAVVEIVYLSSESYRTDVPVAPDECERRKGDSIIVPDVRENSRLVPQKCRRVSARTRIRRLLRNSTKNVPSYLKLTYPEESQFTDRVTHPGDCEFSYPDVDFDTKIKIILDVESLCQQNVDYTRAVDYKHHSHDINRDLEDFEEGNSIKSIDELSISVETQSVSQSISLKELVSESELLNDSQEMDSPKDFVDAMNHKSRRKSSIFDDETYDSGNENDFESELGFSLSATGYDRTTSESDWDLSIGAIVDTVQRKDSVNYWEFDYDEEEEGSDLKELPVQLSEGAIWKRKLSSVELWDFDDTDDSHSEYDGAAEDGDVFL